MKDILRTLYYEYIYIYIYIYIYYIYNTEDIRKFFSE